MDLNMLSTTPTISGYRIMQNIGIARGIVIRLRDVFRDTSAGIRSASGGTISSYTKVCEVTRDEALHELINHAVNMGANAVVGVSYTIAEISPGITEIVAYGTAVIVQKEKTKVRKIN